MACRQIRHKIEALGRALQNCVHERASGRSFAGFRNAAAKQREWALAEVVNGTNLDDLGDYRPGLEAAKTHGVRHPFVEARIDKAMVRALAADLGLGRIAELPSAPCLSSRVETGIAIEAPVLRMIEEAEILLRETLSPRTVRCRVRRAGIVAELDPAALEAIDDAMHADLSRSLIALAEKHGVGPRPVAFAPYRTGSAFLRGVP